MARFKGGFPKDLDGEYIGFGLARVHGYLRPLPSSRADINEEIEVDVF